MNVNGEPDGGSYYNSNASSPLSEALRSELLSPALPPPPFPMPQTFPVPEAPVNPDIDPDSNTEVMLSRSQRQERRRQEREQYLSSLSREELIHALVETSYEKAKYRKAIRKVYNHLLEHPGRHPSNQDTAFPQMLEALVKKAGESPEVSLTLHTKLLEYRMRLDLAQREIDHAQQKLDRIVREREDALASERRALDTIKRIESMADREHAQAEGRRVGFESGWREAKEKLKKQGYKTGHLSDKLMETAWYASDQGRHVDPVVLTGIPRAASGSKLTVPPEIKHMYVTSNSSNLGPVSLPSHERHRSEPFRPSSVPPPGRPLATSQPTPMGWAPPAVSNPPIPTTTSHIAQGKRPEHKARPPTPDSPSSVSTVTPINRVKTPAMSLYAISIPSQSDIERLMPYPGDRSERVAGPSSSGAAQQSIDQKERKSLTRRLTAPWRKYVRRATAPANPNPGSYMSDSHFNDHGPLQQQRQSDFKEEEESSTGDEIAALPAPFPIITNSEGNHSTSTHQTHRTHQTMQTNSTRISQLPLVTPPRSQQGNLWVNRSVAPGTSGPVPAAMKKSDRPRSSQGAYSGPGYGEWRPRNRGYNGNAPEVTAVLPDPSSQRRQREQEEEQRRRIEEEQQKQQTQKFADGLRYSDPNEVEDWRRYGTISSQQRSSKGSGPPRRRPIKVVPPAPLAPTLWQSSTGGSNQQHQRNRAASHSSLGPPLEQQRLSASSGGHRKTSSMSTPVGISVMPPSHSPTDRSRSPSRSLMSPHSMSNFGSSTVVETNNYEYLSPASAKRPHPLPGHQFTGKPNVPDMYANKNQNYVDPTSGDVPTAPNSPVEEKKPWVWPTPASTERAGTPHGKKKVLALHDGTKLSRPSSRTKLSGRHTPSIGRSSSAHGNIPDPDFLSPTRAMSPTPSSYSRSHQGHYRQASSPVPDPDLLNPTRAISPTPSSYSRSHQGHYRHASSPVPDIPSSPSPVIVQRPSLSRKSSNQSLASHGSYMHYDPNTYEDVSAWGASYGVTE